MDDLGRIEAFAGQGLGAASPVEELDYLVGALARLLPGPDWCSRPSSQGLGRLPDPTACGQRIKRGPPDLGAPKKMRVDSSG
jgi:hypothetical protein